MRIVPPPGASAPLRLRYQMVTLSEPQKAHFTEGALAGITCRHTVSPGTPLCHADFVRRREDWIVSSRETYTAFPRTECRTAFCPWHRIPLLRRPIPNPSTRDTDTVHARSESRSDSRLASLHGKRTEMASCRRDSPETPVRAARSWVRSDTGSRSICRPPPHSECRKSG